MRSTCIVLLAICVITASTGCRKEAGDPLAAVRGFISAARSSDENSLIPTVTDGSRYLVRSGDTQGRHGVFYFLRYEGEFVEQKQYKLSVLHNDGRSAQVNLLPGSNAPSYFSDPKVPERLKTGGIAIIPANEDGVWKVDLVATAEDLANAVLASPNDMPRVVPPWWPGMPGMPSPS